MKLQKLFENHLMRYLPPYLSLIVVHKKEDENKELSDNHLDKIEPRKTRKLSIFVGGESIDY